MFACFATTFTFTLTMQTLQQGQVIK